MTAPQEKPKRAQRVIRLNRLTEFLGNKQTQNEELVRLGLLRTFSLSPGGRSKCVAEADVIRLQEEAMRVGSLETLIARAKQERGGG